MQVQTTDPLRPQGDDDTGQPTVQGGRDQPPPAPGFSPGNLMDSWNKWVDKPNNRAALMQFGIAMLQPVGMGETGISHFANAVGAAGQAGERVTQQQQTQEKHESDIDTRETRAQAAQTAANAAEMRALYAGQTAGLQQENRTQSNLIRALSAQAAARSKYDNYALITPEKERLPYQEWIKTPEGTQSLIEGGAIGATATSPGGGPRTAVTPPVSPTSPSATAPGVRLTAKQVINEPRMQPLLQSARSALATGDLNATNRVRSQLQAVLGPSMAPEEIQLLLTQLGAR